MKFLLDESADLPLAKTLTDLNYDVKAIAKDYPQSLEDLEVLEIARREARILITNDLDFGELVFRRQVPHSGVVLFRLGSESLTVKAAWLIYVLEHHSNDLSGFVVITDRGVRVRQMKVQ